jgi:hypothetical protein
MGIAELWCSAVSDTVRQIGAFRCLWGVRHRTAPRIKGYRKAPSNAYLQNRLWPLYLVLARQPAVPDCADTADNLPAYRNWKGIYMRKFIAPLFFALITIAVLFGYLWIFLQLPVPAWIKIVAAMVLGSLIATMAYALFRRKKELDEEDADDLSKY